MLSALRYFSVAIGFIGVFFQIACRRKRGHLGREWSLWRSLAVFGLRFRIMTTSCRTLRYQIRLQAHLKKTELAFVAFEEFDLPQALLRGGLRFIRPTQVLLPVLGEDLVAFFYFLDHNSSSASDFG